VRERSYQKAVERYAVLVTQPVKPRLRRRILERSYSLGARLKGYTGRAAAGSSRTS
jgi:hypothetical protein